MGGVSPACWRGLMRFWYRGPHQLAATPSAPRWQCCGAASCYESVFLRDFKDRLLPRVPEFHTSRRGLPEVSNDFSPSMKVWSSSSDSFTKNKREKKVYACQCHSEKGGPQRWVLFTKNSEKKIKRGLKASSSSLPHLYFQLNFKCLYNLEPALIYLFCTFCTLNFVQFKM